MVATTASMSGKRKTYKPFTEKAMKENEMSAYLYDGEQAKIIAFARHPNTMRVHVLMETYTKKRKTAPFFQPTFIRVPPISRTTPVNRLINEYFDKKANEWKAKRAQQDNQEKLEEAMTLDDLENFLFEPTIPDPLEEMPPEKLFPQCF